MTCTGCDNRACRVSGCMGRVYGNLTARETEYVNAMLKERLATNARIIREYFAEYSSTPDTNERA